MNILHLILFVGIAFGVATIFSALILASRADRQINKFNRKKHSLAKWLGINKQIK